MIFGAAGLIRGGGNVAGSENRPGVRERRLAGIEKLPPTADALLGDALPARTGDAESRACLSVGVVGRNGTALSFLGDNARSESDPKSPPLEPSPPTDFGRGRRLGLYLARLDLVGDMKDARPGVKARALLGMSVLDASTAIPIAGESFRRFDADESMIREPVVNRVVFLYP